MKGGSGVVHPLGFDPPAEWFEPGRRPTSAEYRAWLDSNKPPAKQAKPKAGRRNAIAGTCPILGHRYRSLMERRWGLYLHFLGYRRWTDKATDPQDGGLWYAYERRTWLFPNIRGKNHSYTADYECWPALPDPDRRGHYQLNYVCYEVKGWLDGDSNTKLKRMAKHFPEVPIVVVDEYLFKRYTTGASGVIPGWNDKGDGYR